MSPNRESKTVLMDQIRRAGELAFGPTVSEESQKQSYKMDYEKLLDKYVILSILCSIRGSETKALHPFATFAETVLLVALPLYCFSLPSVLSSNQLHQLGFDLIYQNPFRYYRYAHRAYDKSLNS